MNSKTTLILVLALLIAVAGIWWLRPESTTHDDETSEASRQILSLDPDDVTGFEIKSGDETACSFEKDDGTWQMTSPIKGPAQSRVVADDVRVLADLKYEKAYGPKDDPPGDDLTSLSKPRRVAKLTDKSGKAHVLRIGNQQALSTRTYVSREGDDKVYLVEADLNKTLKHKVNDYRGKRVTDINNADVVRIAVTGDESFTAAKESGGWMIEEPEKGRADLTVINKIINGIANLTVTRFVADKPESLRIYGLEPPKVTVMITTKAKAAGDTSDDSANEGNQTQVAFGSTIEDTVFARIVGNESAGVFEVRKSVLDSVAPALSAVRDKRVVELVPARAEGITLSTQSGESLTLSRDGVNWMIAPAGPTVPTEVAERAAVNDLLNTLRDLKAVGFEETAKPEFGLDNPRVRIQVSEQGKPDPIELALGGLTPSQTGAYVRNVTEDFIAVIPADAAKKLDVPTVSFHSRDIIDVRPDRVSQIVIRRMSQKIVLQLRDGAWHMTSPIDASANDTAVKDLVAELASLKGRAVVATGDQRTAFGLMQPMYTVELTITRPSPTTMPAGDDADTTPPAPETIVLFASRHDGSRYAMLEDGAYIYEVEEKLIADLDKEYLNTNVLTFDVADVKAVTFDSSEGAFRFELSDGKWSLAGESSFQVDKAKLEAALKALGALKATRYAAYENAETTALGLDKPTLKVRIDLAGGETHELEVSGTGPNAADRYAMLAEMPGRAFVLESTEVAKFDKRAADFKK